MVTVQRLRELVGAHCALVTRHRASGEQLLRALEQYDPADPADPVMIDALRMYGRNRAALKKAHATLTKANTHRTLGGYTIEAKLDRCKL